MKIYKVTANIYRFWLTSERSGFAPEEHYFSTKEKAEKWIEEHKTFKYGFNSTDTVATEAYEMPTFETKEIEVE